MGTSHTRSSRASTYTTIFVQKCYMTHVFCGLLAHEFFGRRMKNGTPDLCAGCFVSPTCRAHSNCHRLKSVVHAARSALLPRPPSLPPTPAQPHFTPPCLHPSNPPQSWLRPTSSRPHAGPTDACTSSIRRIRGERLSVAQA